MEVKMNKEIRDYQESMFFGLNFRQCAFSVLAILAAVAIYFGTKGRLPDTVPASGLSDKYEEARPCHDTGGDGRLLYGPYLPDFGDGLFKCQGDRKTAGSVADRISALGN